MKQLDCILSSNVFKNRRNVIVKYDPYQKGGAKDEKDIQGINDFRFTDRYLFHSKVVENIINYPFLV